MKCFRSNIDDPKLLWRVAAKLIRTTDLSCDQHGVSLNPGKDSCVLEQDTY